MLFRSRERALGLLQRYVDANQALSQWWFTFDSDPILGTLHEDARFQAMQSEIARRLDMQKRRYERMVADGRIADRRPDAAR